MANYKCIRPVESLHGKLQKSDKVGFAMRKKSGTKYTVTRESWKQPIESIDPSKRGAVLAHRAKFRAVGQLARLRMADPTKRQLDEAAFKAQTKYTTLFGYIFHDEWQSYED